MCAFDDESFRKAMKRAMRMYQRFQQAITQRAKKHQAVAKTIKRSEGR